MSSAESGERRGGPMVRSQIDEVGSEGPDQVVGPSARLLQYEVREGREAREAGAV